MEFGRVDFQHDMRIVAVVFDRVLFAPPMSVVWTPQIDAGANQIRLCVAPVFKGIGVCQQTVLMLGKLIAGVECRIFIRVVFTVFMVPPYSGNAARS